MKVGVNLAYKDPSDLIASAQAAAGYGFDWVGAVDSPMLFCDTAVASTLLALNTTKCRIGPVVTNPVSRRVEILASELRSLSSVSRGRAALGIGSGDTAVANLGLRSASLAKIEESITQFRALTSRPATGDGPSGDRIPIFVAVGGPKMADLAARLGDGAILGSGIDPDIVAERVGQIRAGAISAGRDVDSVEIWAMGLVHFSDGGARDGSESDLRSLLAAFAHHSPASSATGGNESMRVETGLRALASRYDTRHHLADRSANEAMIAELGLTEALAETYLLPSQPHAIVERFAALQAVGLTGVMLSGTVAQRRRVIEFFGREVMPLL